MPIPHDNFGHRPVDLCGVQIDRDCWLPLSPLDAPPVILAFRCFSCHAILGKSTMHGAEKDLLPKGAMLIVGSRLYCPRCAAFEKIAGTLNPFHKSHP